MKTRLATLMVLAAIGCTVLAASAPNALAAEVRYYPVPTGSHPHDVATAPDGTVWYTAQRTGHLGILDPKTGRTEHIALGKDSSPHGVIAGPDGAAWITDGGQNAIVRVDPNTRTVKLFPLPKDTPYTNLNTAAFDAKGVLWYTGQSGYHGSVNPATGEVKVWNAPGGRGPYGIAATPRGDIYYASMTGTGSGSPNGPTTPSCASTPMRSNGPAFPAASPTPRYVKCWGGPEKRGAPNPRATGWWWSATIRD